MNAIRSRISKLELSGSASWEARPREEVQVCEYALEAIHFEEALKKVRPTASEEEIYKRFAQAKAA